MIDYLFQNWQMLIKDLLFAVLGAWIGAAIAIYRDSKAKPNLIIEPGSLADGIYDWIKKPSRFIHLKVTNQKWPTWRGNFWYGVKPALFCKAKLEFLEPQTKTLICSFQGRWSSTPQPLIPSGPNPNVGHFDPARAMSGEIENILPEEEKEISVAFKIEGDDGFVGFNNWSYLWSKENWKNPEWWVERGSVLLKLTLWWDSGKLERCFVISNEQKTVKSFHIEKYPSEKC